MPCNRAHAEGFLLRESEGERGEGEKELWEVDRVLLKWTCTGAALCGYS